MMYDVLNVLYNWHLNGLRTDNVNVCTVQFPNLPHYSSGFNGDISQDVGQDTQDLREGGKHKMSPQKGHRNNDRRLAREPSKS